MNSAALAPWLTGVGYGCAVVAVLSGACVVTGRQLFHSALALGLSLVSIGGLYLVLAADFLAVAHILIYVGAVLTLIVFAVMLTAGFGDPTIPQANQQRVVSGVIAFSVWVILVRWSVAVPWEAFTQSIPRMPVATMGRELMTQYMLPFELISVIFVACLVGAIAISAQRRKQP